MKHIHDCKTFKEVMDLIIGIFGLQDREEEVVIEITHEHQGMRYQTVKVEFMVGNSEDWKTVTFQLPDHIEDCPVDYLNRVIDYNEWLNGNYCLITREDF